MCQRKVFWWDIFYLIPEIDPTLQYVVRNLQHLLSPKEGKGWVKGRFEILRQFRRFACKTSELFASQLLPSGYQEIHVAFGTSIAWVRKRSYSCCDQATKRDTLTNFYMLRWILYSWKTGQWRSYWVVNVIRGNWGAAYQLRTRSIKNWGRAGLRR